VDEADEEWKTLAKRISTDDGGAIIRKAQAEENSSHELLRLFRRWATDCPLNIAWYERKKRRRQAWWVAGNAAVLTISTIGMVASVVLALRAFQAGSALNTPAAIGASLSFSLAALLGLLKLFAGVADVKAQYAIFWEACSALKEDLYRLEDEWSLRVSGDSSLWSRDSAFIELRAALRAQIRRARAEVVKEQAAFFKTYKSPSELIDAARDSFDSLDSRVKKLLAARTADPSRASSRSSAIEGGAHVEVERTLAVQRADAGVDDVRALEMQLDRLRFMYEGRGRNDPTLAKQIEEKELALAHAKERSEMALATADDLLHRA
jgi:hypothetical protein